MCCHHLLIHCRAQDGAGLTLTNIASLLPEINRQCPTIQFATIAANRYDDTINNRSDIAIRTRQLAADRHFTSRQLAETRRILAARPGYIEQHDMPILPPKLHLDKVLDQAPAASQRELSLRQTINRSSPKCVRSSKHGDRIFLQTVRPSR